MSEDSAALRQAFDAALTDLCGPEPLRRMLFDSPGARAPLWRRLSDLGWAGLTVAEDHGGSALGVTAIVDLHEALGRWLAPLPFLTTALASDLISAVDPASARLAGLASGDIAAAYAFGGPCSNGDLYPLIDADLCRLAIVPQRHRDRPEFWLVDLAAVADRLTEEPLVDPTRRAFRLSAADLEKAPRERIAVSEAKAAQAYARALLAIAADSVGGAREILSRTLDYMKLRRQFGRPIGSFQALKHRVAAWKVELEAAAALLGRAARAVETGDADAPLWAARAKILACETYAAIAGDAIQLHGGIGFTWAHDCHLFFKRAKLNQALFGEASVHKDRIAVLSFAPEATALALPEAFVA